MEKKLAVIVDIDGTIADCNHRLHYIKKTPKDYKAFYDEMLHDTPILQHIEAIEAFLGEQKEHVHIIFLTARPDTHDLETIAWLGDTSIGMRSNMLFMRKEGDMRPDVEVKEEIYERDVLPYFTVIAAFEDRPRVHRMWEEKGLKSYLLGDGEEF